MPVVLALLVVTGTLGAAPPVSAGVLECGELECLPIEEPCTEPECLPDPCEEVSCGCEDGGECGSGGEPIISEGICDEGECSSDIPCVDTHCTPCTDPHGPPDCPTEKTVCDLVGRVVPDCADTFCGTFYSGDTDGDGLENCKDDDDDNDWLTDKLEEILETDPLSADTDGDGIIDGYDLFPLSEADPEISIGVKGQWWESGYNDDIASQLDLYFKSACLGFFEGQCARDFDIPGFTLANHVDNAPDGEVPAKDLKFEEIRLPSSIANYEFESRHDFPDLYVYADLYDHDVSFHDHLDLDPDRDGIQGNWFKIPLLTCAGGGPHDLIVVQTQGAPADEGKDAVVRIKLALWDTLSIENVKAASLAYMWNEIDGIGQAVGTQDVGDPCANYQARLVEEPYEPVEQSADLVVNALEAAVHYDPLAGGDGSH